MAWGYRKTIFGLLVLILLVPKTVFAVTYVHVSGYVYDANDKPLSYVRVSTKDNYKNYSDYSDVFGHYLLSLPESQKYTLKYEKQGYETQTKDIEISHEDWYEGMYLERVTMVATTDGTITGTWKGNYTIPDWSYSTDFTVQLEQNGNDITGDATTSDGCKGTLTGTIDETIITFKVKGEKSGGCCKSKWKGTAIITCSQDYMVMTFTIKDKCNGKTVGSGELWKQ
ncbi:MAG: carboxypeptidase-like regulatory domain-containing protein [Candidatus Brocadia sp.]|jgi:hypothetical protein